MFHNFEDQTCHNSLGVENDYDHRSMLDSSYNSSKLNYNLKRDSCAFPNPKFPYSIISDVSEEIILNHDISQLTNLKPDIVTDIDADYQEKVIAQEEWRQQCDQKLQREVQQQHLESQINRVNSKVLKPNIATVQPNTLKKPDQKTKALRNNERKTKIVHDQNPGHEQNGKKLIPVLFCPERFMYVNAKQADRILKMRAKRLERLRGQPQEVVLGPKSLGRFTTLRVKDPVRSRVAFGRKRVGGLFVSKKKQRELSGRAGGDSDTEDPD